MNFLSPEYSNVFRILCYFFLHSRYDVQVVVTLGQVPLQYLSDFITFLFTLISDVTLELSCVPVASSVTVAASSVIMPVSSLHCSRLSVVHLVFLQTEQTDLLCKMMAQAFISLLLMSRLFTAAMLDAVVLTLLGLFFFGGGFFYYFAALCNLLSCWNSQLTSHIS